jgi:hypothetical protein
MSFLNRLSRSNVGCHFGENFCGALCYADDLTLLAPNRSSIKLLLKICQDFAKEYSVKYNANKSVYICYNDRSTCDLGLDINGHVVYKSTTAIHLGSTTGPNCAREIISRGKSKLVASANLLLARFGFCSSSVVAQLFNSFCTSFYGAVLWRLDLPSLNEFYVAWRKIVRRIWRVHPRTHCNTLPYLMNSPEISLQLLYRFKTFHSSYSVSNNRLVRSFIHSLPFSRSSVGINRRIMLSQSNILCNTTSKDNNATAMGIKELCNIRDNILSISNEFDNTDVLFLINSLCIN